MLSVRGKKGAEESNVIIFVILALVVAGLVIYFAWNFFNTGSKLIDGNDPSITVAIESCKVEIGLDANAYCTSAKSVKIKGGGDMIVSCQYINEKVRKGSMTGEFACANEGGEYTPKGLGYAVTDKFYEDQCSLIRSSGVSDDEVKKVIVNGAKCA